MRFDLSALRGAARPIWLAGATIAVALCVPGYLVLARDPASSERRDPFIAERAASAVVPAQARPAAAPATSGPPPPTGPIFGPLAPPDFDEVSNLRPLLGRQVRVGAATYPERETLTLRRNGSRASLRVAHEVPGERHRMALGPPASWKVDRATTYVGRVVRRGGRWRFQLASAGGETLEVSCRPERLAVHRAGAQLVPTPRVPGRYYAECTDRGVWRPAGAEMTDVLACTGASALPGAGGIAMLAPRSGVEWLGVSNDCALTGAGYRSMSPSE